jgi:GntR family transcriptional regulator
MATTSLQRSSHVALYQQIAEGIESEIAQRRLPAFHKLPSEVALMARYGVSRITVRQAIDLLVRRGLVIRKHGKGTFVSGPALEHDLHELRGIYESIEATGLSPRTRLLDFAPHPPPDAVRKLLGQRGRLMRLKRLYLVDEVPLGLIVCWLPPEAEGLTVEDAETNVIYGLLRRLGLDVARADLAIGGRAAGRRLGRLLGCPPSAALLVLERVSYGSDRKARDITRFFVRSDGYRFTMSLQGPMPLARNIRPET